jgi:hypothetical protein
LIFSFSFLLFIRGEFCPVHFAPHFRLRRLRFFFGAKGIEALQHPHHVR